MDSWSRRAPACLLAVALLLTVSAAPVGAATKLSHIRLWQGITVDPARVSPMEAVTKVAAAAMRSAGAPRYFTNQLFASDEDDSGFAVNRAGDLDGDGKPDLVGVRFERSDGNIIMTIAGIRGIDGKVLWTREVENNYSWPISTRVGPDGDPGVLLVQFTFEGIGAVAAYADRYSVAVESISGSGETLWQQPYDGYAADTWFTSHALDAPMLVGLLDGIEGPASDLMIDRITYRYDPVGEDERSTLNVVDGRDGSVAYSSGSLLDDTYRYEIPVPDLSGDGLDDYLEVQPEGRRSQHVTARTAADGGAIWEQDLKSRMGGTTFGVGDATGDDIDDLVMTDRCECFVVVMESSASSSGVALISGGGGNGHTTLVDGATGDAIWKKSGDPNRLGDINGDGLPDIGLQEADYRRPSITYSAVTGTGERIYRSDYSVGRHGRRTPGHVDFIANVGDVDGDGSADALHRFEFADFNSRRFFIERGIVSGTNGEKLWAGDRSRPLHATVDGTGDDLYDTKKSDGTVTISIEDGRDGSDLWTQKLEVGKARAFVNATDVTGDGRAEVLVNLWGSMRKGNFGVLVLDPSNGHLLWELN